MRRCPGLLLLAPLLLAVATPEAKADCRSERQACRRATSAFAQCGSQQFDVCDGLREMAQRACSNAEAVCQGERQERSRDGRPRR